MQFLGELEKQLVIHSSIAKIAVLNDEITLATVHLEKQIEIMLTVSSKVVLMQTGQKHLLTAILHWMHDIQSLISQFEQCSA